VRLSTENGIARLDKFCRRATPPKHQIILRD
jgi:hypothetical protein